jgi:hypothetical protein
MVQESLPVGRYKPGPIFRAKRDLWNVRATREVSTKAENNDLRKLKTGNKKLRNMNGEKHHRENPSSIQPDDGNTEEEEEEDEERILRPGDCRQILPSPRNCERALPEFVGAEEVNGRGARI